MKNNRGFSDLVSYVDIDLKDKLTSEEQEEIYHLLLVACNSARDSGAANCNDSPETTLKSGESWLERLKNHWDSKINSSDKG